MDSPTGGSLVHQYRHGLMRIAFFRHGHPGSVQVPA